MEGNGTSLAILIGVWMTFALDVFSTLNSSPQTTEINADRRADSLMYWVAIGAAVAVGGGVTASLISRRVWPIVATAGVAAGMFALYLHAKQRGLAAHAAGAEGTET